MIILIFKLGGSLHMRAKLGGNQPSHSGDEVANDK
jgi:hypothetical protein